MTEQPQRARFVQDDTPPAAASGQKSNPWFTVLGLASFFLIAIGVAVFMGSTDADTPDGALIGSFFGSSMVALGSMAVVAWFAVGAILWSRANR